MANIVNQYGQVKLGVRYTSAPLVSTLWGNIFGVWNADTLGTSLDTSIFRAYNGEAATVTPTQLSTNIFGVWNADGTNNLSVKHAWNANGDAVDSKSGANGTIATPSGTSWTPTTMTYGSGKLGSGAFTFNGSNFVSLPTNTLNFTGDFSVSAWIYVPTAFGTNISRIISCFDNQLGVTTYRGWEVVYNNGTVKLQIYPSGANYYIISVPMTLKDQWVHVTAVRLAGQQGEIYINGVSGTKTVSANGATSASAIAYNGTSNLAYIGALYDVNSSPRYSVTPAGGFKIDALQAFNNAALDQAAVTELYNSGNGQEYPFTLSSSLIATYNDAVGSNHGTTPASTLTGGVPGPSFTTGKIGKAFNFDGVNDYVSLTNSSNLTGDFSISVWINPSVQGSYNMIFEDAFLSTGTNRYGIALYIQGSRVRFATYNGTGNLAYSNTSTVSNNTWQHIVITKTTGNAWKMYINNTLQSLITVVGDITTNPGVNVNSQANIGSDLDTGVRAGYFNGKIDALNVWNRAITNDEITALYNSGNGQQYPFSSVTLSNSMLDSVNAQNGTNVNNVTLTTGKVGNAFTFNGSNYISLPTNSLNLSGDFSINLWWFVNITNDQALISNRQVVSGNQYGWQLYYNSGWMYFYIGNGTSTVTINADGGGYPVSTWVNITLVRKSGTSTKLYVNGLERTFTVSQGSATNNPAYTGNQQYCAIGNCWNGTYLDSYMKNGSKIDALTVWNKALTTGEITSLYNGGSGAEYPFSTQLLPSYNDAVGSNHGTTPASTLTGGVPGPSFTTGKIGKAFNFDGINDMVTLPNNSLDLTGDFSISMWANWGRNNTSQILMSNLTIGGSIRGWFIEHAAGQLRFRGLNSSGGDAFYLIHFYTPPLNTWVHYTFVHKNNSNKMYIDGVLISPSSAAGSTHVAYDTPNYPMIGANQYNATTYQEFFQGKLDAVSVWNKELTAEEVTDLYNSGNGKQYPN